jgi:hypothetical protein
MIDATNVIAVLHADGAAADRAGKLALYGQFVGDWRLLVEVLARRV